MVHLVHLCLGGGLMSHLFFLVNFDFIIIIIVVVVVVVVVVCRLTFIKIVPLPEKGMM